eukprot:1166734-Prymnesium_polylepis.2
MDHVEEAVVLFLVLVVRDVRDCVRLDENDAWRSRPAGRGEELTRRGGSDQVLLLREADRGPRVRCGTCRSA